MTTGRGNPDTEQLNRADLAWSAVREFGLARNCGADAIGLGAAGDDVAAGCDSVTEL